MQTEIHSIHHVNFPTTDKERTKEWYSKVFGMVQDDVSHLTNTPVLLMRPPGNAIFISRRSKK